MNKTQKGAWYGILLSLLLAGIVIYDLIDTAALTGLGAGFMVFFSATLIAFLSVGPGGKVEIGSVLGIFQLSAMSFFFTESAAVLMRYGSGGNDNE